MFVDGDELARIESNGVIERASVVEEMVDVEMPSWVAEEHTVDVELMRRFRRKDRNGNKVEENDHGKNFVCIPLHMRYCPPNSNSNSSSNSNSHPTTTTAIRNNAQNVYVHMKVPTLMAVGFESFGWINFTMPTAVQPSSVAPTPVGTTEHYDLVSCLTNIVVWAGALVVVLFQWKDKLALLSNSKKKKTQ
eukprot:m.121902 g.121902  ORF g.121902 m.121902 type:complete len:191 (+) comp12931_c1_seq4:289-861(+)